MNFRMTSRDQYELIRWFRVLLRMSRETRVRLQPTEQPGQPPLCQPCAMPLLEDTLEELTIDRCPSCDAAWFRYGPDGSVLV